MKITKNFINQKGERETQEFADYWEMVDFMAENRINLPLPNGNIEHSKGLVQRFVKYFDGELMLYTIDFKKEVFDEEDIITDFKNFLQRKGDNNISVIVQKDELLKKERKFYQEMKDEIGSRVNFKKFDKGQGGRFMVIGDACRRALIKDDQNFIASVNFNDKQRSDYLRNGFNLAYKNSKSCDFV